VAPIAKPAHRITHVACHPAEGIRIAATVHNV
jgi:hypothetical protein